MTMHQFCIDDAQKYGVEGAIVLANMRFWIAKNKANERHFYQGRYWTYNSARAFSELFPYWSPHQIRRILAKLVSDGVMVVGEFNQNPYDHTKWYSLNCEIDFAKSSNRIDKTVTSLDTDSKQDSKPNNKKPRLRASDSLFDLFWQAYPKRVGKDAARKAFDKRKPNEELVQTMVKAIEQQQKTDTWIKGFVPNPATWLNDGRWQDEVEATLFNDTPSFLAGAI